MTAHELADAMSRAYDRDRSGFEGLRIARASGLIDWPESTDIPTPELVTRDGSGAVLRWWGAMQEWRVWYPQFSTQTERRER